MNGEKGAEQRCVVDDCRVEADMYDLGMTGITPTHRLVVRVRGMPPHVAGENGNYAIELLEGCFKTPEAATGQSGLGKLGLGHRDPCGVRIPLGPRTRQRVPRPG